MYDHGHGMDKLHARLPPVLGNAAASLAAAAAAHERSMRACSPPPPPHSHSDTDSSMLQQQQKQHHSSLQQQQCSTDDQNFDADLAGRLAHATYLMAAHAMMCEAHNTVSAGGSRQNNTTGSSDTNSDWYVSNSAVELLDAVTAAAAALDCVNHMERWVRHTHTHTVLVCATRLCVPHTPFEHTPCAHTLP